MMVHNEASTDNVGAGVDNNTPLVAPSWACSKKVVITILLAFIVLGQLIYSTYQNQHTAAMSSESRYPARIVSRNNSSSNLSLLENTTTGNKSISFDSEMKPAASSWRGVNSSSYLFQNHTTIAAQTFSSNNTTHDSARPTSTTNSSSYQTTLNSNHTSSFFFTLLTKADDQLACTSTKELGFSYAKLYNDIKYNKTANVWRVKGSKKCINPTIPMERPSKRRVAVWRQGRARNVQLAANTSSRPLDLVILGDSIIEHWLETDLGKPSPFWYVKNTSHVWKELFDNGHHAALPLGLSGDQINQLLYRIMNGEMPDSLNPKAWWILIGTNDYSSGGCNKESILAGIMAVLEEGLRRKPTAKFVLQGILPRKPLPGTLQYDQDFDFEWINTRLSCLTQVLPEQLYFFNASSCFLTTSVGKDDSPQIINETLMPDSLHPSATGYRVWGTAMVEQLKAWSIFSL